MIMICHVSLFSCAAQCLFCCTQKKHYCETILCRKPTQMSRCRMRVTIVILRLIISLRLSHTSNNV